MPAVAHALTRRWLPLLIGLILAVSVPRPVAAQDDFVFLGLSAIDLKLDVDDTLDVAGPTHFFSSRHRMHAGGRFAGHFGKAGGRAAYLGQFFCFGWGKSGFLLNWETPGVLSYPPLDAGISWGYLGWGVDGNLVVGDILHLTAFASGRWFLQKLTIDIDGEDFDGSAHKLVGSLGGMASVNLGVMRLCGGASLAHFVNADVDWEVDDLTFASRHTDPSVEYFAGVVLK
jgi:hypothetical protein